MLMLHGSGGHAYHGLEVLQQHSEEAGFILAGPASPDYTWDAILSRHGPVAVVNGALDHVFARYAVDASHIAIAGFSDGASRALSLGLANGDLFTHVIAFSPGFVLASEEIGRPRVLISHGTRDEVQPVADCSRRILAQIERMDLDTEYVEFEGGHRIPPDVARYAVDWFIESPRSSREQHPQRFPESRVPPEG
jgi:poly(3-hydroxybutyrate) depolymerase